MSICWSCFANSPESNARTHGRIARRLSLVESSRLPRRARRTLGDHRFALALFHCQRERAIGAYSSFINAQVGRQTTSPLVECNPNDHRILGSDDFAARMLGKAWPPRSRKTLEDIIGEGCAQFGVAAEDLCSASRVATVVKARAWIASQAVKLRVASIAVVARRLRRDESSLRHGMQRYFGD